MGVLQVGGSVCAGGQHSGIGELCLCLLSVPSDRLSAGALLDPVLPAPGRSGHLGTVSLSSEGSARLRVAGMPMEYILPIIWPSGFGCLRSIFTGICLTR